MKTMKKILFFAAAITVMVGCTNDNVVGENPEFPVSGDMKPISFGSFAAATTRADYTGATAAEKLGNNFVVQGVKGNGTTQEIVYNNYNVNFVNGTANTTTSNTAGWEYVAQTVHPHATAAGIAAQSIKYWDYAADQYDFIAYSAGSATAITTGTPAAGQVLVSAINASKMNGVQTAGVYTDGAYTVEGAADDLAKVYIADMVTAYRDPIATSDYNKEVEFKFRSLSAKVRVALYETIPGYSVKDVKFYTAATTKDDSGKAHLFTEGGDVFNKAGKYIVYFPTTGASNKSATDYNKAHVAFEAAATDGTETSKTFGALDLTNKGADKEVAEAAGKIYLGRASNAATYAGENTTANPNYYTVVIPNEKGAQLNLKVDYTLVSTDGSGEVINVIGATAQVPAVYGAWKSGYAYTYIFKISRNTNGSTNPSAGPAGLYPITFDAVVTETEDGIQETITTVAEPSITTYAKGAVVTANDEYTAGSNIYVMVNGATLTAANSKLFTITLADGAAQTINEASVANVIANGTYDSAAKTYTVTDANSKNMVATESDLLSIVTEIAAADAPDGNAIAVNAAKFSPTAGIYAFQYTITAPVAATPAVYAAVANGTTLIAGTKYYTDNTGAGEFEAIGTEVANGSNYYEMTTAAVPGTPGVYAYKIIKVQ